MTDISLNASVKEALESTDIMALSTLGSDGSWVCPLHYNYNDKLELTFVSMLDTKHVQNILKDPRVSVAIYHVPGPSGGSLALQIKGRAEQLTEQASLNDWHRFRIIPEEVWCYDSRVARQRQQLDITNYNLTP